MVTSKSAVQEVRGLMRGIKSDIEEKRKTRDIRILEWLLDVLISRHRGGNSDTQRTGKHCCLTRIHDCALPKQGPDVGRWAPFGGRVPSMGVCTKMSGRPILAEDGHVHTICAQTKTKFTNDVKNFLQSLIVIVDAWRRRLLQRRHKCLPVQYIYIYISTHCSTSCVIS